MLATTAATPVSIPIPLNVAARLSEMAQTRPQSVAVAEKSPEIALPGPGSYRTITFEQLDANSSNIAAGLKEIGIHPGMRIALLVRPGIDFVSLVFALLKLGAVQVLIDPGMGMRRVMQSLAEIKPQGFIGLWQAQMMRRIFSRNFSGATLNVTVGERGLFSSLKSFGPPLEEIRRRGSQINALCEFRPFVAQADSPSAIIFTSGSTGPAKGVLYRHGNFANQVTQLRDFYAVEAGDIDVSCFPLFGLFNAAMGVTTIFPKMDFSRPARVDPQNIVAAVNDWQASQAFGSPAVWNVVGRYCEQHAVRMPSLRRVLSAGAPVAALVLRRMTNCIHPQGMMHTPYGATEALPMASISAADVLGETIQRTEQGGGVCVGGRFGGIQWRVIQIHDEPIATLDEAEEVAGGEIGELIVRGPVVTTEYVTRTAANSKAKIRDGDGFWHRMGDVGYLDEHDRFWFCGRLSQRVRIGNSETLSSGRGQGEGENQLDGAPHPNPLPKGEGVNPFTLFTIPCEAIFNRHPAVFRSALVGVGPPGRQRPAIIIEPLPGRLPRGKRQHERFIDELRKLGQSSTLTAMIHDVFIRKSLLVDVRHNVKINREQLAIWAARKMR